MHIAWKCYLITRIHGRGPSYFNTVFENWSKNNNPETSGELANTLSITHPEYIDDVIETIVNNHKKMRGIVLFELPPNNENDPSSINNMDPRLKETPLSVKNHSGSLLFPRKFRYPLSHKTAGAERSEPRGSRGCCCGCRGRCCSDCPPCSSWSCCSSCRPGSRGWSCRPSRRTPSNILEFLCPPCV